MFMTPKGSPNAPRMPIGWLERESIQPKMKTGRQECQLLCQANGDQQQAPRRIFLLEPTSAKPGKTDRGSVTRGSLADWKALGLAGSVLRIQTCCGSQSRAPARVSSQPTMVWRGVRL